jgi:hypothetical protein
MVGVEWVLRIDLLAIPTNKLSYNSLNLLKGEFSCRLLVHHIIVWKKTNPLKSKGNLVG